MDSDLVVSEVESLDEVTALDIDIQAQPPTTVVLVQQEMEAVDGDAHVPVEDSIDEGSVIVEDSSFEDHSPCSSSSQHHSTDNSREKNPQSENQNQNQEQPQQQQHEEQQQPSQLRHSMSLESVTVFSPEMKMDSIDETHPDPPPMAMKRPNVTVVDVPSDIKQQNPSRPTARMRFQFVEGRSFFFIDRTNPIRVVSSFLVHNEIFINFIYCLITTNLLLWMCRDFGDKGGIYFSFVLAFDFFCMVVYTIELVLKITAKGLFMGRATYLKFFRGKREVGDINHHAAGWNRLNFIIVLASWVAFAFGYRICVIRTFYLLKPLRELPIFSHLPILIDAIFGSIPLLSDVITFLLFSFFVFGITSLEFYQFSYSRRCTFDGKEAIEPMYCSGGKSFGFECPSHMDCTRNLENPNNGATHFDNIIGSFLTMFVITSLSNWTTYMYPLMNSEQPLATALWFVLLIFFSSWIVTNLFIAVFMENFDRVHNEHAANHSTTEKPRSKKNFFSFTIRLLFRKYVQPKLLFVFAMFASVVFEIFSGLLWLEHKLTLGYFFKGILQSHAYEIINIILILASAVCQAIYFDGIPESMGNVLNIIEIVLTIVFVVEIVVRILGMGVSRFFSNLFNLFDVVIVVSSCFAIYFYRVQIIYLRAFRLFLYLPRIAFFDRLLRSATSSVMPLLSLLMLALSIMVVFAIIGMQVFRGLLVEDDGSVSRENFENMFSALITQFKILTGDEWTTVLYAVWKRSPIAPLLWFVAYYTIGNYLVLNFFGAIVLEKYKNWNENFRHKALLSSNSEALEHKNRTFSFRGMSGTSRFYQAVLSHFDSKIITPTRTRLNSFLSDSSDVLAYRVRSEGDNPLGTKSHNNFCTSDLHPVRLVFRRIAKSRIFRSFYLLMVLVSSITMAFEPPSEANRKADIHKDATTFFLILDLVFFAIFFVEFLVKVIARGVVFGPRTYFRKNKNRFDFFLLVVQLVSAFVPRDISYIRGFRTLRALRPLRILPRIQTVRNYFLAIVGSANRIVSIALLALFSLFLFGILGVSLFSGRFNFCNDPSIDTSSECVGVFTNDLGIVVPRAWIVPESSFDNVFKAMRLLLEVSSVTFSRYMFQAMDMRGPGEQPRLNSSPWAALYFVVFLVIGSFFLVNLFIGVVMDNVKRQRGEADMSDKQKNWLELKKSLMLMNPQKYFRRPRNMIRALVFDVASSRAFSFLMTMAIIVNIIVMCTQNSQQPDEWKYVLLGSNSLFTLVFILEFLIKFVGFGMAYFSKRWNVFEFSLMFSSAVTTLLEILYPKTWSFAFAVGVVARLVRILRILLLIRRNRRMKDLWRVLKISFPNILGISVLLIVVIFIYAIIGMQMFGNARFQDLLNNDVNFRSFPTAALVLFRLATLDDWNWLMYATAQQEPYCTETAEWNDCGSTFAYVYFISFYVIGSYIILNLMITIIIDNFTSSKLTFLNIFGEHIVDFHDTWSVVDPLARGMIPVNSLRQLVDDLHKHENPLGFDTQTEQHRFLVVRYLLQHEVVLTFLNEPIRNVRILSKIRRLLKIGSKPPQNGQHVFFHDVVLVLCRMTIGEEALSGDEREAHLRQIRRASEFYGWIEIEEDEGAPQSPDSKENDPSGFITSHANDDDCELSSQSVQQTDEM